MIFDEVRKHKGTIAENFGAPGERVNHNYGTRGKIYTACFMGHNRIRKKLFWFQGPSCFNELPVGIQSLDSIVLFKHQLEKHMQ